MKYNYLNLILCLNFPKLFIHQLNVDYIFALYTNKFKKTKQNILVFI